MSALTAAESGERYSPNVDGSNRVARRSVVAARVLLVDEVLDDGADDHRQRGEEEAQSHSLDGRELDASLSQGRVDDLVEDGCNCWSIFVSILWWKSRLTNHDNERNRVQIVDQVVRDVALHGTSLHSQIGRHLIVAEPEDRDEGEDGASLESTSDLVDPFCAENQPYVQEWRQSASRSSKVIHLGVSPSCAAMRLGFTFCQKSVLLMFSFVWRRFLDHALLKASRSRRKALGMTEPAGGVRV